MDNFKFYFGKIGSLALGARYTDILQTWFRLDKAAKVH